MTRLKKICPRCFGNGYIRIPNESVEIRKQVIAQCTMWIVKGKLIMKNLILIIVGLMLISCSEIMIVGSMGGAVVSQSPAVKAYNGVDVLTIGRTDKSIKQHAYEKLKGENDR